jgi:hypothetical protein
MTNRTSAIPRPGASVRFEIPDTLACSNRTANRTPVEREPDSEPDRHEPDSLHEGEPDKQGGVTVSSQSLSARSSASVRIEDAHSARGTFRLQSRPIATGCAASSTFARRSERAERGSQRTAGALQTIPTALHALTGARS